ncbi:FCD domain-containing protein [Amycolatopsis acidicola]|uniref:FCD domain-containing protein n=1 Tax=Amycolatopsis acidicola TaxID=2596893 RepID=A0A5N0V6N1_9PSEU|nr:flavin reductase [Amycolatopsis acidicola]KAA9160691.1 FCD domain-containing protein [Amycolatopsis acidicola]
MTSATSPHSGVDGRHFRHVVGHLASGVTIVTTAEDEITYGMTASSVTSLSADPATMLACLNNSGPTAAAVARSGRYAVNVLGEANGTLATRFATPHDDKFAGVPLLDSVLGVPLLADALAHLECEVVERIMAGTHSIFVGRVVAATAYSGRPLTYFRGGFGRFALAQEDAAYRTVRDLVLKRAFAPGSVITVVDLADGIEIEPSSAFYALTRLEADGLVTREADRGYVVTAFDARTSDTTFDARLVIELGVIEQVVGELGAREKNKFRQRFDAMAEFLRDDRFVDFDAYLDANYRFHETLVDFAGSRVLTTMFEGLAIKQVMTRSFGATQESSQRFLQEQQRIVEAFEAGDKAGARDAARAYNTLAKDRAREVLAMHGGVL